MRASIAASATAEPETPPMNVDRRMQTWASPPAIQETSTFEASISRSVIPVLFIMCPARTKSGTARSGKLCDALATCWTPMEIGMKPEFRKKEKPAMPMAKAIGMPSTKSPKKTMERSSMGVRCPGAPSRRAPRPSGRARR